MEKVNLTNHLQKRSKVFFNELKELFIILSKNDLEKTSEFINNTTELFRGAQGLRHIDFIGYKA